MPLRRSCFQIPDRHGLFHLTVSMPLRRSCFAGIPAGFRGYQGFQCHYGVPASDKGGLDPEANQEFQCHYGVPASWALDGEGRWANPRFNATTAFLLPPR